MVEEDLRSSCIDFIIPPVLRYGSFVGVDDSFGTAKETELVIMKGRKKSEIRMHKQGRNTGLQKVKSHSTNVTTTASPMKGSNEKNKEKKRTR